MDAKAPAGSALEQPKWSDLFSNSKIEVKCPPSKEKIEVEEAGKRKKVTKEEKLQRMTGPWRSKSPSPKNVNGDNEKKRGSIALEEHNHEATAHNQNENSCPDLELDWRTNSSDSVYDDSWPPHPSSIPFIDGLEDPIIIPSDKEDESEEIYDHFRPSGAKCDAFSKLAFPKDSLPALSAPELQQDRITDISFTPPESAMRKLPTMSEPLSRHSGDHEYTIHTQPLVDNEVQSYSQTLHLSPSTPHCQPTNVSNTPRYPSVPQSLQAHEMYGSPVAGTSRSGRITTTNPTPENNLAGGVTLQSSRNATTVLVRPPPGFDQRVSRPPRVQTPRALSPNTMANQRMQQWALRQNSPEPAYIHGTWPSHEDIDKGTPSNPLTWEQLVAVHKAEDEQLHASTMRTTRAAPGLEHTFAGRIGTGFADAPQSTATTVLAFGQQHLQSSDSDERIRDAGDRGFRDTRWERTLGPTADPWAFDARFDRTRVQHVCRCALCQRMGRWFADPQPTHVVRRPPGL